MRITFLGAAGGVTGSMHLIETGRTRVLLDCGLFQGRRDESWLRNMRPRIDARSVDAVVLSHAHIDHSGALPLLWRQGFKGSVFMTKPTAPLTSLLLADGAAIQARDNAQLKKRGKPVREPLYSEADAEAVSKQFVCEARGRWFAVTGGVSARFHDAGHILGSSSVHLEIHEPDGGKVRLTFTGDYGRHGTPVLRDPEALPPAEVILTESTYGDRVHAHRPEDMVRPCEELCQAVKQAVGRGGKLLIPAFSVGRTQNLLWTLNEGMEQGTMPRVPVFVDSPLGIKATQIMEQHPGEFDARALERVNRSLALLKTAHVHYTETVEASKSINEFRGSAVILAGSGMCESGRVLHHLVHLLPEAENIVALSGFQAPYTLGRRLEDGQNPVFIFGDPVHVRAEVVRIRGLSAHADQQELLQALLPAQSVAAHVFVVHGDPTASHAFGQCLRERGFKGVEIPDEGSSFTI
jgi:metallo-beta-lactamase family protein